jgi:hypothetical protein
MTYAFTFRRGGEEIAAGSMTSVCCVMQPGEGVRPRPIPASIAEKVEEERE